MMPRMKSIAIAAVLAAAPCVCFSAPEELQATFTVPASTVVDACAHGLPQSGIECAIDGADSRPFDLNNMGISLSRADAMPWDLDGPPRVYGVLHLTSHTTPAGVAYFTGTASVFKQNFFRTGLTDTQLYNRQFWEAVEFSLTDVLSGSPEEARFLADADEKFLEQQHRKEQAAQQKAAAEAAMQAEEVYRASPKYKVEMAARQVESCRDTIARARRAIAQDERVANISGYENKLLREQAALAIVNCQDLIARGGN